MRKYSLHLLVSFLFGIQLVFSSSVQNFISTVSKHYDSSIRPNMEASGLAGDPVAVTAQIYVVAFDSVTAATMDFKISMYLRLFWKDSRLKFQPVLGQDTISLPHKIASKLWMPDIFFANEKNGRFHKVMQHNQMARVSKDGSILLSTRLSLVLACNMDLRKFPMDNQVCGIKMMSYAYSEKDIILRWQGNGNAVEKAENLEIPQFELTDITTLTTAAKYSIGNYSLISVNFGMKREFGYYFTQTFMPSMLVVALSWVSFWISADSVPARISLGLLTVLTMTTLFSGINASLPKVSYAKAIDVWTSVCLLLVFSGLLEFAAINVFMRKSKNAKTPSGKKKFESYSKRLDIGSRIGFPLCFLIFNICYWPVCLT